MFKIYLLHFGTWKWKNFILWTTFLFYQKYFYDKMDLKAFLFVRYIYFVYCWNSIKFNLAKVSDCFEASGLLLCFLVTKVLEH